MASEPHKCAWAAAMMCVICASCGALGLQCEVQVTKDHIIMYEPLHVKTTLTNDGQEEMETRPRVGLSGGSARLEMRSGDNPWAEVRTAGSLRGLFGGDGARVRLGPGVSLQANDYAGWNIDTKAFLLPTPGRYQLRILHRAWDSAGELVSVVSNVVEVECADVPETEAEAATLWATETNYYALEGVAERDAVPGALEFIQNHPESVYLSYARAVLDAMGYKAPAPLFPDDERLLAVVDYEFPEFNSLRDVFALWQQQSGVPLRVVDAVASRRMKCLRQRLPLRDAMRGFQSGDTVWEPDGKGYVLTQVEKEGGIEEEPEGKDDG